MKHAYRTTCLFLSLLCVTTGLTLAQAQRTQQTTKRFETPTNGTIGGGAKPGEVIMLSNEDYRMAAKDVIEVVIEDAPELSKAFQINAVGQIPMPFLGNLKVLGMTTDELARTIATGLRGRYLKDPKVSVAVAQYNSRSFFIQGAVRSPNRYIIEGRPTLFRLITIAGGLQENHGSMAYIIREKKKDESDPAAPTQPSKLNGSETQEAASDDVELLTVNINGLFRGEFENNLLIEPGDVVSIPVMDVFYVAGEVGQPGAYPLKEGTTLRQAIALAQGTLFKADTGRAVIFRDDPKTGVRKEIPIDVQAVMTGKSKEDLPIQANDIIMVPNSRVKSVSQALLQALGTNSMRAPFPR
jgi:polysaccharide export outer membrane protein